MTNLTEKALAEALMDELKKKPLDKITVKEMTAKCGLTRNTFYYHYKDVYDLLSHIFSEQMEELRVKYAEDRNWEDGLEYGLNYLYEHKSAIKNLNESRHQDLITRYINHIANKHSMAVVTLQYGDSRNELDASTVNIVAKFYKAALLGALLDWIAEGMKERPRSLAKYYNAMFRGTFEAAVEAARNV